VEELEARRAELQELQKTFGTEGWRLYQKDLQELRDRMIQSAPDECPDGESWLKRQAVIHNLTTLLVYADAAEVELASIEESLLTGLDPDDYFDDRNPLED
jgi:hypothetical protein